MHTFLMFWIKCNCIEGTLGMLVLCIIAGWRVFGKSESAEYRRKHLGWLAITIGAAIAYIIGTICVISIPDTAHPVISIILSDILGFLPWGLIGLPFIHEVFHKSSEE